MRMKCTKQDQLQLLFPRKSKEKKSSIYIKNLVMSINDEKENNAIIQDIVK